MNTVKNIKLFFKGLLISIIVAMTILISFLSSHWGKDHLVKFINRHFTTQSYDIDITSLSSFFPLVLSVGYIELKEQNNTWLRLQDLTVRFNIAEAFFKKNLELTLDGQEISLMNLPLDIVEEIVGSEEVAEDNPFVQFMSIIQNFLSFFHQANIKVDLHNLHLSSDISGQNIDFTLEGAALNYNANQDRLFAKLPLTTKSFGSPLNLILKAEGGFKDFALTFNINTPEFFYENLTLQDVVLRGKLRDLPLKGLGYLELNFLYDGIKGSLIIPSVALSNHVLFVKGLSLRGFQASVHGDMTYNLDTDAASIQLKAKTQDVKPLAHLMSLGSLSLSGAVNLEANLEINGEQSDSVLINIQGANLKSKDVSIDELIVKGNIENFLMLPTGFCDIKVKKFKSNELLLDTVTLQSNLTEGKGPLTLKGYGKALTVEVFSDFDFKLDREIISFKQFDILYNQKPFKLKSPFTIEFFEQDILVSPATFQIANFPLTFQGKKQREVLNFSLKGGADLSILSQLFLYTGDIVRGLVSADIHISGTLDQPHYKGTIDLKKGYYENAIYGTKLHNLSFKAQAKDGLITLRNVKARDGSGGYLHLNGSYDLFKKFFAFKAEAVNMRFAYTDQLKVIAQEGKISIRGPFNNMKAVGFLKMKEVAYNVTAAFAGGVAELNVVDPLKSNQKIKKNIKKSPDDLRMTFDFDITIPPVMRVYGLGLDSLWEGKLKVTQSMDTILMIGKILLKEGNLDFLGQNIAIKEGSLTFDGQENNIPYLDLNASLEKKGFKAIVALKGRATKPTFSLSSEPSLPQEEILSQLLFGSDSSKLSPLSALKLAKIATELSGATHGGSFVDLMKSHLGKEEVKVNGGEDQKEATFKSKESLSDRVHIHLDQGVTPADSRVVIEVEVTPKISVSTETGASKGSDSVGVNYNWDY